MIINMLAAIHIPFRLLLILSKTSAKNGMLKAISVYALRIMHTRVRVAGVLRVWLNFLNMSLHIV